MKPLRQPKASSAGTGNLSGHRARKRFGQHFLSDGRVIAALLDCINPQAGEVILEIGPGLGALTEGLLERVDSIRAVELDRDLARRLSQRFESSRLDLIEGDALKVDWETLLGDQPVRLVGNLPYNISTPLLVRLINCHAQVSDQHFMLQREVVQRIIATQGSDYSRLGILLQAFYVCEQVLDVPAQAFTPAPKVESAVVRMCPHDQPKVPSAKGLSALLSSAFGQRRKMLRGTLLPWLAQQGVETDLIEPTARPEQVSAATYYELAHRVSEQTKHQSS